VKRGLIFTALAVLLAGCGGTGFRADKGSVASINSVALVAFSVPNIVAEEAGGGALSGVTAMVSTLSKAASGGGLRGNGAEVAQQAAAGLTEELSKQSNLRFVAMSQVLASGEFKSLVGQYDQSRAGHGSSKSSSPGLPVIVLTPSMPQSDFAAQAAKALGVDGVVMVDVSRLNYFLYTGAMGSGQAKAKGAALFKVFDRTGRAVWESGAVVYTEESAAMLAGGLNPAAAPALNKDVGTTIAKDLLKTYRSGG